MSKHSLTIVFGPTGTAVAFLFNEKDDAMKALASTRMTSSDVAVIKDDFGQHAEINTGSIHGRIIEDLAMSGEAAGERQIQNVKSNAKMQNKAANDPALRLLNGGMAMNHPGAPIGGQRRPI